MKRLRNYNVDYCNLVNDIECETKKDNAINDFHLFLLSIIHRTIHVNKGMILLVENKCYEASIPLLRTLLDSILIAYGCQLVDNSKTFYTGLLKGLRYTDIETKMKDGKNISLHNIAKALDCKDGCPGILDVYSSLCSYPHFSSSHLYSMVAENGQINIDVSNLENNSEIIENICGNYNDFNTILLHILYDLRNLRP